MSELKAQLTLIAVLIAMMLLMQGGMPVKDAIMLFAGLVLAYGFYVLYVRRAMFFPMWFRRNVEG